MRKIVFAALAALVLFCPRELAAAPQYYTPQAVVSGGTIAGVTACPSGVFVISPGAGTAQITISGTFVASLRAQATGGDFSTFSSDLTLYPRAGGGSGVTTMSAPGIWTVPMLADVALCVYGQAYTSGTAAVTISFSPTISLSSDGTGVNVHLASSSGVACMTAPGTAKTSCVLQVGGNDGTNAVQFQTASAADLSAANEGNISLLVSHPGQWSVTSNPVAATAALASKGAGAAGVRHIAQCVTVGLVPVAAQTTPLVFNLRDGATGAGTILWSLALIGQAGVAQPPVTVCGLNVFGTAATAMTLESAAAPGASNFAFATLLGFDAS